MLNQNSHNTNERILNESFFNWYKIGFEKEWLPNDMSKWKKEIWKLANSKFLSGNYLKIIWAYLFFSFCETYISLCKPEMVLKRFELDINWIWKLYKNECKLKIFSKLFEWDFIFR